MCSIWGTDLKKGDPSSAYVRVLISWVSPLGRALMKSAEGDSVVLQVPGGTEYLTVPEVCYERISVEPFREPSWIRGLGKGTSSPTLTVPKSCWKLAVVEGPNASAIVVDIPNNDGIGKDTWQKYATTLEDVEKKTGLHLTTSVAN